MKSVVEAPNMALNTDGQNAARFDRRLAPTLGKF